MDVCLKIFRILRYFSQITIILSIMWSYQVFALQREDYCALSCGEGPASVTHVVCERKNEACGPSVFCNNIQDETITEKVKEEILQKLNEYRNQIAQGYALDFYVVPTASNMRLLNWDEELEYIASCHVNSCKYDKNICRKTSKYDNVEMILELVPVNGNSTATILELLTSWASTVRFVSNDNIEKYIPFRYNSTYENFAIISAGDIDLVGCGYIIYEESKSQFFFVCLFASTDDLKLEEDKPIYRTGNPCTQCPINRDCDEKSQFKNLCTREKNVESEFKELFGNEADENRSKTETTKANENLTTLITKKSLPMEVLRFNLIKNITFSQDKITKLYEKYKMSTDVALNLDLKVQNNLFVDGEHVDISEIWTRKNNSMVNFYISPFSETTTMSYEPNITETTVDYYIKQNFPQLQINISKPQKHKKVSGSFEKKKIRKLKLDFKKIPFPLLMYNRTFVPAMYQTTEISAEVTDAPDIPVLPMIPGIPESLVQEFGDELETKQRISRTGKNIPVYKKTLDKNFEELLWGPIKSTKLLNTTKNIYTPIFYNRTITAQTQKVGNQTFYFKIFNMTVKPLTSPLISKSTLRFFNPYKIHFKPKDINVFEETATTPNNTSVKPQVSRDWFVLDDHGYYVRRKPYYAKMDLKVPSKVPEQKHPQINQEQKFSYLEQKYLYPEQKLPMKGDVQINFRKLDLDRDKIDIANSDQFSEIIHKKNIDNLGKQSQTDDIVLKKSPQIQEVRENINEQSDKSGEFTLENEIIKKNTEIVTHRTTNPNLNQKPEVKQDATEEIYEWYKVQNSEPHDDDDDDIYDVDKYDIDNRNFNNHNSFLTKSTTIVSTKSVSITESDRIVRSTEEKLTVVPYGQERAISAPAKQSVYRSSASSFRKSSLSLISFYMFIFLICFVHTNFC